MPNGEKAQTEPQQKPVNKRRRPVIIAVILAVALIAALVIVATTSGFGPPSVGEGEVALVEGVDPEGITQEAYDHAMEQAAAGQGLDEIPPAGDPARTDVNAIAMNDLLLSRWVVGEAEERGLTASDREIETQLEQIKQTSFGGDEQQFKDFLERSKLTEEEAFERVRLQVLSQRIQEQITTQDPQVTDEDVDKYYADNPDLFHTPERRDVRIITTKDEADAETVADQLAESHSAGDWAQLATKYSLDQSTAATGAMNLGLAEGEGDPALDAEVFAAEKKVVGGPIQTAQGWSVYEVDAIDEAVDTPLDAETRASIRATLQQQVQQEEGTRFQTAFIARWTARTICADDVATNQCANAPAALDPCLGDDPEDVSGPEEGEELECPAFVTSLAVVNPGAAHLGLNAPRLYQGPQSTVANAALEQAVPIGAAPGAAGGAAPAQ